jgi:hypothetical protein
MLLTTCMLACMQVNGFLAKAALARAGQPYAPLQAAFSDTRPTYSRDAQDDEPLPQDEGMGEDSVAEAQHLGMRALTCMHAHMSCCPRTGSWVTLFVEAQQWACVKK